MYMKTNNIQRSCHDIYETKRLNFLRGMEKATIRLRIRVFGLPEAGDFGPSAGKKRQESETSGRGW